jgi:hypothetical protein
MTPPRGKFPEHSVEHKVLVFSSGALSVEQARGLLLEKGFKLDTDFPAVIVDPPTGRFVLRGMATLDVVEALSAESDLQIFPDLGISS